MNPYFQLTTKNGIPTFYIYFDNMDAEERLVVYVMIYHLDTEEYEKTVKKIREYHGKDSVDKNEELEFMKYIIFNFKNTITIIDMDTLRKVSTIEGKNIENELAKRKTIQKEPIELSFEAKQISNGPSIHRGHSSKSNGFMRFKTKKNGHIVFTLSRFPDPNVRNGISLSIQKNVNKKAMYGALIYATHPNYLRVRKISKLPIIPNEKEISKLVNCDYWEKSDSSMIQTYMGKKQNDTFLLPKGKKRNNILNY